MIYNRIPVTFRSSGRASTEEINYQYDIRQVLVIQGVDGLPERFRVDFCNEGDSTTKPMIGTNGEVEIPDEYLRTGKTVKAYIILAGEDAEAVETRLEADIPVRRRPTPTDVEPTPEEQSVIDQLIADLNSAVGEAEQKAEDAEAWAVGERDGVPVTPGDETYENNAKYYAGQAEDSADEAEAASEAIQNMGVSANTLAEGSAASVSKSVDPETGAVSLTFGIPRGNTGNGIASIELLSTSGLDKTYRITMTGGGYFDFTVHDGNGIASVSKTSASGLTDTYTITFTDGTNTTFEVVNGKGIISCVLNQDYTLTINYNDGTSTTTASIRGATGATGATPDISIGTVTTGAAGSDASASMTGTPENPVLNLTIPKGADGDVSSASMAKAYSPSKTYAVGDYCWYAGKLQRCVTAITTAEAWTAAHWAATSLEEEIENAAQESTAQILLGNEEEFTFWFGFFLSLLDNLTDNLVAQVQAEIDRLPSDENGQAIAASIAEGNGWLQMLLHEVPGAQ